MNSEKCSPGVQVSASKVILQVAGLGHVPSFKNCKRVFTDSATGNHFPGTRKDVKLWMERVIQSFESQLRTAFQTTPDAISTGRPAPSTIALYVPLDDSRQWIPDERSICEIVEPGQEGAIITIERID